MPTPPLYAPLAPSGRLPPLRPEGAILTGARLAVDLSPAALLSAGVSGVLAADLGAAESGRWSLATRAEDLAPSTNRVEKGLVAVVEVLGPIDQRATFQMCGGITDGYDTIEARFKAAVDAVKANNAELGKVVLMVDSPGGVTTGGWSTVRRMRAYAKSAGVRVESVADYRAASMGYALLLVGDHIHVPPDGRTASIGTVIVRQPENGAEGTEVFRSGDRKMRPNSIEPLNKEDREDLQALVDASALDFAELVAEVRGKTAEHWLSLKGAAMSGAQALKVGLIDSLSNLSEVIEMALSDAARAELAESIGLDKTASEAEIKAKLTAYKSDSDRLKAVESELSQAKGELAKASAALLAVEEKNAQEKAKIEAQNKRSTFAADVKAACDAGFLTPAREAKLMAHYDKHGEASARDSLDNLKADAPIVQTAKPGAIPGVSSAELTQAQKARAKQLGVDENEYASHMAQGGV